ncbi:MerR family transcriptional regulator [Brevibacillus reuszeri]|uniref:MerR family transcriptional regulator n=1 Tax=Brevibacillus reuszeri TaxID=54915 RepID=UPI003D1EC882
MFKIGEFSKISQVSVKTLRYYDQLNLLKPDHIDQFTGYRYYSADQMFQLHRIFAFKELGFSLDQIRQMLGEQIPLEQIRGMFRIKKNEIQTNLDREAAKLARITERLCFIEKEGKDLTSQDVILKEVESQLIVSCRQRMPFTQIPSLFKQLDHFIGSAGGASQTQMVIWHGCEECEEDMDIEVARLLTHPIQAQPPYTVQRLPEAPMMATLIHHCSTISRCTASTELAMWIEKNGYRMKEDEPRREVCLPHKKFADPNSYVAELQIAVERA